MDENKYFEENENTGLTDGTAGPQDGGSAGSFSSEERRFGMNEETAASGGRDKSRWIPKEPESKEKKSSGGKKKWMGTVAAALVFGLVAGSVTYATNRAAESVFGPVQNSASDTAEGRVAMETSGASKDVKASGSSADTGSDMTVEDVVAAAMPSMVTVSTMSVQEMRSFFGGSQQYEVEGAGTGFIVGQTDKELLIATNEHVVSGATEVSVGFIDETVAEVTVKGEDEENDLAILSVSMDDIGEETMDRIRIAVIGDSDAVSLGDQVVAIGNALGYGQSVTVGYVSALDRSLDFSDEGGTGTSDGLIQTDAAINAGNSGGALLNMKGEVIGINEAKSSSSYGEASVDNMGYAIPMDKAVPILEEMMNGTARTAVDEKDRGYLGISMAEVTEEYSQVYSMPVGICITEVMEGSPAQQAGLQKGDILTSFDGHTVTTQASLQKLIAKYRAGETVEVLAQRADNGEYIEKSFSVTLGTAKQAGIDSAGGQSESEEQDGESYGGSPYGDLDENDIFEYFFGDDGNEFGPFGGYGQGSQPQQEGPSGS